MGPFDVPAPLLRVRFALGYATGAVPVTVSAGDLRAVLATVEPLHEWPCPNCGATTRARMADHPPGDEAP